ncbi:MFS general substrate transporter [Leucogyrophana mollusca]|uniref:MFS general substrate transporter n=1 Tax=Leucogyrophana mollusca TaxID=85980 RepID=A0ACB8BVQ7_9AGAM|nr:MFS general substrate transporter [Leucogyrophana mollusca]
MSHHRSSRNHSAVSARSAYSPQPESLVLPDGPIDEPTAELLDDITHPHHQTEETLVGTLDEEDDGHIEEVAAWKNRPWWKRPSAVWLLIGMPISSIGFSSTLAPRVELYTMLVCRIHRPEYVSNSNLPGVYGYTTIPEVPSASVSFPTSVNGHTSTELGLEPPSVLVPRIPTLLSEQHNSASGDTRKQCAADPVVQAATAKLAAVLTTTIGVLGCLTTGWWGSLSDRFGRTPIMAVSSLGLLATDTVVITTVFYVDRLPGGYWFLLVGMMLDGLFGGMSTGVAAMHAYLADVTTPSTRSRVFSMTLGLMFTGVALGPVLGGLLVRTTGSPLSVFYFAAGLHAAYLIYVGLVVPESLTKSRANGARERHQESVMDRRNVSTSAMGRVVGLLRGAVSFLSPLAVLLPERVDVKGNPLKKPRRDWSLCFVAASYGFTMMDLGSLTYKFQYAAATFGWSSETVSYFIALAGAGRALLLAVILPLIIRLLRPSPPAPIQLPAEPDEPLQSGASASSTSTTVEETHAPRSKSPSPSHSPAFDLNIARVSLFIEVIAFSLLAVASSGAMFTAATFLGAFGSGFSPAIQAFALELFVRRGGKGRSQAGKLFGAISVVQVLATQIIGPSLFGYVYVKTVGTFPRTILFMTAFSVAISLTLLSFVRAPSVSGGKAGDAEEFITELPERDVTLQEVPTIRVTREDTLVDAGDHQEPGTVGRKGV